MKRITVRYRHHSCILFQRKMTKINCIQLLAHMLINIENLHYPKIHLATNQRRVNREGGQFGPSHVNSSA
jgi:hypothetical protein